MKVTMKEKEIIELLDKLTDAISDRNSCLSNLAKSQIPLMEWLAKASINHGNDMNGNKEKYQMVKEQVERIDELIRSMK